MAPPLSVRGHDTGGRRRASQGKASEGATAVGRPRGPRTVVVAVLLLLLGVGLIAYPYASTWLNQAEQNKVAKSQQEVVAQTSPEDLSAQMAAAQDFNRRLFAGKVQVTDPFDPNVSKTTGEEYESLLNLAGDGVMAQITIPSIGVSLPIYHDVDGDGMQHGVGHMPSTSLPVGGESTHSVLAGHTGLPSAKIFDDLNQLKDGDWFIIQVLGEDHAYRVTSTEVVLPDETSSLAIVEGEDMMTLVTCTPYGVNTHRLLVHAKRCEVPQEWLDRQGEQPFVSPTPNMGTPLFALTLVGVAVGSGVVMGWLLVRRRRKRVHDGSQT